MSEDANQQSTPGAPTAVLATRMEVVVNMERILLVTRYAAYLLIVGVQLWGASTDSLPDLMLLTVGVIVHNVFVHWVLHTGQYAWFVHPLNFFIHLGKVSLLVLVTGGEQSPAGLLYLAVIVGYCIYTPRFQGAVLVTMVATIAYAATLFLHWYFWGIGMDEQPILVQVAALLVCGWMMNKLGRMMRRIELDGLDRAAALASSEATLRAILDSAATPIIVYDDNEFICDVNDAACKFLKAPRERLLGARFRSFLFDDGTLPTKLATLRAKGEYLGEALLVREEDGQERNINVMARSFVRDNSRVFVALLQDITEQKDVEESQRLSTLQLEQVNRELKRVHSLRTAFFTAISQRLRSPLSAILGHVDLLLNEELGPVSTEQRRALLSSRRSAERVFALLDEAFEVEGVPRRPSAVESAPK